jgi:hypothetical protein
MDMDDEMDKLSREALARLATIDEDERRQLGYILTLLSDCYGKGAKRMAVLVFRRGPEDLGIMGVNANDMDAADMVREAADVMNFALTRDAPAKEMFN